MRPASLRDKLPDHALPAGGSTTGLWPTLLVVDHDAEMLRTLVCYFEQRGFHVAASTSLAEAKAFFHRHKTWALVISDYHLPDGTGLEFCCWVRDQTRGTPFLLMSGSPQCAALCAGTEYLAKPFPLEELATRVRALVGR